MKSIKVFVIPVLISLLFLLNHSTVFAGDFQSDSLALVAIYDSTDGDNWTNNTGWKTAPVVSWYGIELLDGRVANVYLQGNNLNGSIPPQIGDLDSLTRIDFNGNNGLTNSLPPEIGNLSKLERLYLYTCNLTGSIPPELGNLASIKELILERNSLTGPIPASLGNLSTLTYLGLHSNELSDSIPPELGDLSNLQHLTLNNNNLSKSIPSSFGNLTSLKTINLYNNEISGSFPVQMCYLPNLNYLNLGYNQISGGIPAEIVNMSSLRTLDFSSNPLGSTIPPELGNLSGLQYFYAGGCELVGPIPKELTNLPELITLDLSMNQLTDSITYLFGSMTNLKTLNFYTNLLSGTIPTELGNLTNLEQLSLSNNDLTGTIPPQLGNLSNLIYLELYGNELTGSIPPELGNLTNLRNFIVSENHLTGEIPPELGNLINVSLFFVQNNMLSGPVPAQLANLTNLTRLHLVNNMLEDLPDLSGLELLTNFQVYGNKFTFGDLEPNIHILDGYTPQDTIGTSDTVFFVIEDTLSLATPIDGLYNNYQWTFNGGDISDNSLYAGTNDSVLLIKNPSASDVGAFSCRVTNDTVTGLTLDMYPITIVPSVKVTSLPEGLQCAGFEITIAYKSAEVSPGNIFTAELSDSLGSFENPDTIGSIISTDLIGTIDVYIRHNFSSGDQYRIRINASNPSMEGVPSSDTLAIYNSSLQTPVITPSDASSICEGESLKFSTDVRVFLQYIWYIDGVIIEGAITDSLIANEEGSYYVKIYDFCSPDSLYSNAVDLIVNPLPPISLALDGTILTATVDQYYSYVWYKDGEDLNLGDTEYEYTALENGEYRVIVTDENGCVNTSNSQHVSSITSIENAKFSLDVFPNPTHGKVNFAFNGDITIEQIIITNIAGQIVLNNEYLVKSSGNNLEFDMSDQKAGIYLVNIRTNSAPILLKLIKL